MKHSQRSYVGLIIKQQGIWNKNLILSQVIDLNFLHFVLRVRESLFSPRDINGINKLLFIEALDF